VASIYLWSGVNVDVVQYMKKLWTLQKTSKEEESTITCSPEKEEPTYLTTVYDMTSTNLKLATKILGGLISLAVCRNYFVYENFNSALVSQLWFDMRNFFNAVVLCIDNNKIEAVGCGIGLYFRVSEGWNRWYQLNFKTHNE